jgi:cytochrome P450
MGSFRPSGLQAAGHRHTQYGSDSLASLNALSLPTNPDRAEIFARARRTAPVFDSRLDAWIVLDPDAVTRLLQDPRLVMPDANAALAALEAHRGIRLPHLHWMVSVLPLLNNGEQHRRLRQALAKHLSGHRKRPQAWQEAVASLTAAALAGPGRLDAFRDLLVPCVNAIFADVTGVATAFEPLSLTRIFDRYTSLRQFLELEDKVAALRDSLKTSGVPAEAEGMLASLFILGRDSLLASLSESVIHLATDHRGRRLDDPASGPPQLFSGVPIAERVATAAFSFDNVAFAEGDRIRMYFQGFHALDREQERLGFFGSGAHTCIGRPLATAVWSFLAGEITKSPRTVAAVEWSYDRALVFTMPRHIFIDLT